MKRPVANRILIEVDLPDGKEEKSTGGIILATGIDTHTKELGAETGTILSIGPTVFDTWGVKDEFKVGDRVHFRRYAGVIVKPASLKDNTPGQRIMDEEDILVVEDQE